VLPFGDEEEAVRLANDTRYGLDAYVWTSDRERGRRLGRRLEAGSVMLNDCITNYGLPDLPFGGVKESGFGRAHGEEGLRAFSRTRSEAEPRFPLKREPHWFPGADRASWSRALVKMLHGRGIGARLSGLLDLVRGEEAGPAGPSGGAGARRGVGQATAYGGDPEVEGEEPPEEEEG
jgi:succinate-semialdehyde dehydrogenase/glutarate-semialdehyde dehydrogenase